MSCLKDLGWAKEKSLHLEFTQNSGPQAGVQPNFSPSGWSKALILYISSKPLQVGE